jgi:mRNA interferase HigB
MRVIARNVLVSFWGKHPEAKVSLERWHTIVRAAQWTSTDEVQKAAPKAKALNRERVRFEVAGGNYRLVAAFDFRRQIAFVRFIGTHAEYDRIDALKVSQFQGDDMDIRPIRTDQDHRAALAAIEACWGAPEGTEEGDKLDVLVALVGNLRGKAMADRDRQDLRSHRRAPVCHRRTRPYPGRAGRPSGLAFACVGSSFASASAHGRDDSQGRRSVENSGAPSGSSLQASNEEWKRTKL